MEEDFRALLLDDEGVRGLAGGRVDWGGLPSAAAPGPYVVLWVVDAAEGLTQQGPDGLSIGRVQVDCYGGAYTEAKRLARAVIAALTGARQRGFQGVFHVGTRDSREGGSNEAVRPYRCSLDFETFWTET